MIPVHEGHLYGLKTQKGIALMQVAEEADSPTTLLLVRVCDGFLAKNYTDEEINCIVQCKELFFLNLPLQAISRRSKIYQQFFAFDQPWDLPEGLHLPQFQRGYSVLNDGTIKWYKKRRKSNDRRFVKALTPDFLKLSPDACWSLPDICEFLEQGKKIEDYI